MVLLLIAFLVSGLPKGCSLDFFALLSVELQYEPELKPPMAARLM